MYQLGTIGAEYEIHLKDTIKPQALCTTKNVPIPLYTKVQEELHLMQLLGVISPINELSPWCTGMIVVPKPYRFKPLNEAVLCQFHPLLKEKTLVQLTIFISWIQTVPVTCNTYITSITYITYITSIILATCITYVHYQYYQY